MPFMDSSFQTQPPRYAVIVAGGSGSRMQSQLAKQYLPLLGKPVLFYTLDAFRSLTDTLVLVLPEKDLDYWKELCTTYHYHTPHLLVAGGASRFASVRNGLAQVPDEALVAIHDGVRPLVTARMINNAFALAAEKGAAVATVPLKDSLRRIGAGGNSQSLNREDYRLVQTPQTFRAAAIKQAYQQPEQTYFTDCASVAEAAGLQISLSQGDYQNLKITTPEDLLFAEAILKQQIL